ncbi:MAG: hypothetical protein FJ139_09115 [Deltaproteobacteria bacterium]|nr:hypothetical protein [Deltaproteobacteria bacterium]
MIDKRMTLKEAVAKFIQDGDTVYYGGFQIHVPMALTHEVIRQKKKNLTTVESSTDVGGLDILVGAGCVTGNSYCLDHELVREGPICHSPGIQPREPQEV